MSDKFYGQVLPTEDVEEDIEGERRTVTKVIETKTWFTPSRLMWFLVIAAIVVAVVSAISLR